MARSLTSAALAAVTACAATEASSESAASSEDTSAAAATDLPSASTDHTDPAPDDGTIFDVSIDPPQIDPPACSRWAPVFEGVTGSTPHGAFAPIDGVASLEFCSRDPYLFLSPLPDASPDSPTDAIFVLVYDDPPNTSVYDGVFAARFELDGKGEWGEIEFLEPFDLSATSDPAADVGIHAQLEVHVADWDLSAQVELPFCGAEARCFCECD